MKKKMTSLERKINDGVSSEISKEECWNVAILPHTLWMLPMRMPIHAETTLFETTMAETKMSEKTMVETKISEMAMSTPTMLRQKCLRQWRLTQQCLRQVRLRQLCQR